MKTRNAYNIAIAIWLLAYAKLKANNKKRIKMPATTMTVRFVY